MSNLKYRIAIILALVVASAWALFPRDVTVRQRRPDGTFYDTVQRRVPLRKGLDLQGGMHLTLEVDESKRAVSDKADAIDRALKVVRSRIEGFGVSEPVIQKAGSDRVTGRGRRGSARRHENGDWARGTAHKRRLDEGGEERHGVEGQGRHDDRA